MADPFRLEQVFSNRVNNAITFHQLDQPLRIHSGARSSDSFKEFR
ncbi:MAG: hypothetical protein AB7S61_04000 [Methanoregulaceae archaeon]